MKNYESIPFLTDEGEKVEFFILEQTMIGGISYLLVEEDAEDSGEEGTVYIMRNENSESDDLQAYSFVEDEEELSYVMKVFEQLLEDADLVRDF